MPWTTLTFYVTEYLKGDTTAQIVPDVSFNRVASRAEDELKNGRNIVLGFAAPEYLQKAVCELSEYLYMAEKSAAHTAAGISGFSNDGYSVSYSNSNARGEIRAKAADIRRKYLSGTELHNQFIYAGVRT